MIRVLSVMFALLLVLAAFFWSPFEETQPNMLPKSNKIVASKTSQKKSVGANSAELRRTNISSKVIPEPTLKPINNETSIQSEYQLLAPEETIFLAQELEEISNYCYQYAESMESKGEAEIIQDIQRTIDSVENSGVILSSAKKESIFGHYYSCKDKGYLSEGLLYVKEVIENKTKNIIGMGNEKVLYEQSSSIALFGSMCLQPELKDEYLAKRIIAYGALEKLADKGHTNSVLTMVSILTDIRCLETYDLDKAERLLIKHLNYDSNEVKNTLESNIEIHNYSG